MNKANAYFGWLFLAAACVYLFRLGTLAFTTDEIYHGIAARAILETGKPLLPNGALYLKGVLFSYPGALFTYIFGAEELGVRFTSALCLLLTGIVVHKLTTELAGPIAGLLASFVWFFHPWTIELARWGRMYSLAALLFTTALYFLLRFEARSRRADLWAACGFLVVATAVYPFCIWGIVAFGVYGLARASQSLSRQKFVRLCALALSLAAALGVAVALLIKYSPVSILAFTGFTGDHAGFKVSQFVGFSAYYLEFFFTDLSVFALSLVALSAWATRHRKAARSSVVLLLTTLGAVGFVSFFHLQAGASRYLFAVFPATVVGTVYFWASVIEARFSSQSARAYAALSVLAFAGYLVAGSFEIPFKRHGEPYENPSFGPTPKRIEYDDFKSAPVFVKEHAAPDDLLITNTSQFFYFYAEREADYDLKLGRKSKGKPLSAYMSKTREINDCGKLAKLIKTRAAPTTWLALHTEAKDDACVRALAKKHNLELVYQGPRDENAKVYKVTAPRS